MEKFKFFSAHLPEEVRQHIEVALEELPERERAQVLKEIRVIERQHKFEGAVTEFPPLLYRLVREFNLRENLLEEHADAIGIVPSEAIFHILELRGGNEYFQDIVDAIGSFRENIMNAGSKLRKEELINELFEVYMPSVLEMAYNKGEYWERELGFRVILDMFRRDVMSRLEAHD